MSAAATPQLFHLTPRRGQANRLPIARSAVEKRGFAEETPRSSAAAGRFDVVNLFGHAVNIFK
jgi:hypothetical protein